MSRKNVRSAFEKLTRKSKDAYTFDAYNVTTARFEDKKQGAFFLGQTYDALVAIKAGEEVHKTINMSLDHLRKIARHMGFRTGMSCMQKQAIILTLGRLNSGLATFLSTMTQAYKWEPGTILRLINMLFGE